MSFIGQLSSGAGVLYSCFSTITHRPLFLPTLAKSPSRDVFEVPPPKDMILHLKYDFHISTHGTDGIRVEFVLQTAGYYVYSDLLDTLILDVSNCTAAGPMSHMLTGLCGSGTRAISTRRSRQDSNLKARLERP